MNYQVMKRHGENFNAYYLEGSHKKALCCMTPSMCHSRTGRTMETEKAQWLPGDGGEEKMNR
jgi:hypothetical protein